MTTQTVEYGRLCNQIIRNIITSEVCKKHNLKAEYSSNERIKRLGIELFSGDNEYSKEEILCDKKFNEILNKKELKCRLNPNKHFFQGIEKAKYLYSYFRRTEVMNSIKNNNPFKDRYNNNNDCFIHIRLGDLGNPPAPICYKGNVKYYKFIEYVIDNLEVGKIFIGTDSANHKELLRIVNMIKCKGKEVEVNREKDEVKNIQFGSTCKHIVLTNGSYGAITGFLGYDSKVYIRKGNDWKWDYNNLPKVYESNDIMASERPDLHGIEEFIRLI